MDKPNFDNRSVEDRGARMRLVIDEYLRRRTAGESISDESLLATHPDLLPELAEELSKLKLITAARQRADDRAGPALSSAGLHIRCPHCHNRIELVDDAELESITCPSCGSSFSILGDATKTRDSSVPKVIGHFELIDQVGMGQFGAVWMARDTELDRTVAVKIPRKGQLDRVETEQFLREARAAAQLRHPNIVSVHEVGREGELVYIVSDFVKGATLADWLTGQRLTPRESAELCVKLAQALHHAHEAGVIHRDLKPSNIMLDLDGEPHLTDFGLAKRAGEVTMTLEGRIIGTPAYMSPEQARGEGHSADRRSDIYSLGVILFQLLTGEIPFRGNTRMLIVQILNEEPPNPRKLQAAVPRDLETITLKCLEKDPSRRFATAQDVADELRRYLAGESILSRPVGQAEQLWRWCRRNPGVASLTAALLVVFLAGFSAVTWKWLDAESQKEIAKNASIVANTEAERSRRLLYASDMLLAHQLWEAGNLEHARELLDRQRPQEGQQDLRGFEWRYLWRLCRDGSRQAFVGHKGEVTVTAFFPNGTTLASAGQDGTVKLWDTNVRREVATYGRHGAVITSLAVSKDGNLLATASDDGTVKLFDIVSGKEVTFQVPGSNKRIALSSDGGLLASTSDKAIKLWDLTTRQELDSLQGHDENVISVCFSPDGKTLASGGADTTVRLWDVATRREIDVHHEHTAWVFTLAFSHNGQVLASAGDDATVQLWNIATKNVTTLRGHTAPVLSVAFSPDGKSFVTGSSDSMIRVWDTVTWQVISTLRGHTAQVKAVTFSLNGKFLASASLDHTVRLWDVTTRQDPELLEGHKGWISSLAFSPDGQTLAVGDCHDETVKLWDLASRRQIATLKGHAGRLWSVAFSPNGKTLASSAGDQTTRLWRVDTKQPLAEFQHAATAGWLSFSPNGELLARSEWGGNVRLWEIAAGRDVAIWPGVVAVIAPDGKTVAVGRADGIVALLDATTQKQRVTFRGHGAQIASLAFAPDGLTLATSSRDRTIRLWDIAARQEVACFKGHTDWVGQVAFAPDSKILASAGSDSAIKLWNLTVLQGVATLKGHIGVVTAVAFSHDGDLLATAGADGVVRLWRAASFRETDASDTETPTQATRVNRPIP